MKSHFLNATGLPEENEQVEKKLKKFARRKGINFPITDDEVNSVLHQMQSEKDVNFMFTTPSPFDILITNSSTPVLKIFTAIESTFVENLAMAAREGKDISEDVKKKMKQDRANAQKNNKS